MLLLPVAVLAVALACRLSAIYALTLSSISAILLAVFLQGFSTADVLTALYQGVSMKTGNALVNEIYSRGGITSMTTNITSLLCSLTLGGALSRTGVMVRIAASLISITRTRLGLTLASFTASFRGGLPGCSYTNALEFLFHNSPDTIFMEWPLRFLACFVR